MEHYFKDFLNGQSIILKQMASSDLEAFINVENEKPTLLLANDEIPFPHTVEDHSSFFRSISGKKKNFSSAFLKRRRNSLLGHVVYIRSIGLTALA